MANGFLRVIPATLAAVTLAVAGVLAQGNKPVNNPAHDAPPVGTFSIEGIADAATAIYAFGFHASNTATATPGGGGGAGKADLSDIFITRRPDTASPGLFRATVIGQHVSSARVDVYAAGTTTVQATYQLTDVLVSAVATGGGVEQVSLRFSRIAVTVGGVTTCFDVSTNSSC